MEGVSGECLQEYSTFGRAGRQARNGEPVGRSCKSRRLRHQPRYGKRVVAWRMLVGLHLFNVSHSLFVATRGGIGFCANAGRNTLVRRGFESSTGKPVWHLLVAPCRALLRCPAANAGGTTDYYSRCHGFESRRSPSRGRSSVVEHDVSPTPCRSMASLICGECRWNYR